MDYETAYKNDSRLAQAIGLTEREYESLNHLVFKMEYSCAKIDRYYCNRNNRDTWRSDRDSVHKRLVELLYNSLTPELIDSCGLETPELEQLRKLLKQIESGRRKGLHSVDVLEAYRNARSGPIYYHWMSPAPGTCKFISHCLATRWENREFTLSTLNWALFGTLLVIALGWFSLSLPVLWIPTVVVGVLVCIQFWAVAGSAAEQERL
jgi:hypothetical protein